MGGQTSDRSLTAVRSDRPQLTPRNDHNGSSHHIATEQRRLAALSSRLAQAGPKLWRVLMSTLPAIHSTKGDSTLDRYNQATH